MPKGWGGVARRGAADLNRPEAGTGDRERQSRTKTMSEPPPPMDQWVPDRPARTPERPGRTGPQSPRRGRTGSAAAAAGVGGGTGGGTGTEPRPLPDEVATEIRKAAVASTPRRRETLVSRMGDAVSAYERGRYQEAARMAKQVDGEAPNVPAVKELLGLAAYRSGRWREGSKQLEAYRLLTGDVQHDPVLMDCYRGLGRRRKVADLFSELRQHSPGPDILAEARIVAAGSLADDGDLNGAISLLAGAGAAKALRNPGERHLRQWFALADLYERAGDVPRARELYLRVFNVDRDAYGVADRLDALGPQRRSPSRRRAAPRPAQGTAGGHPEGTAGGHPAGVSDGVATREERAREEREGEGAPTASGT